MSLGGEIGRDGPNSCGQHLLASQCAGEHDPAPNLFEIVFDYFSTAASHFAEGIEDF